MTGTSATVLLSSRSTSGQGLGGPVWTVRELLREQQRSPVPGMAFAAILADGAFASVEAMGDAPTVPLKPRLSYLRYVGEAAGSVPRLLQHLPRAARAARGAVVLHCHDFISAYLSRLQFGRRYPLLLTVHAKGGGVREMLLDYRKLRRTPVTWLARHIERRAVGGADLVVFPSRGAQEMFAAEHPGLLDGKALRIVYTGIDPGALLAIRDDPQIMPRYGVRLEQQIVMSVAAMVWDKGLDTLMLALAHLPAATREGLACVVVARQGPLEKNLRDLIERLDLSRTVRLVPFLPRVDLVQLLQRADVFVLPSRAAVFDLVLLEAAALGVPVVTTAVGGNVEMFDDSTAVLVPPDDPYALAEAVMRVLANRSAALGMAQRATARVHESFSVAAMLRSYVALYQELLGQRVG